MLVRTGSCIRGAAIAMVMAACGTAFSGATGAQELGKNDLQVRGLSVYTETARDIYIAGMLMPEGAVLDNLLLAPPPKAMEFRLATRRISGRGFAGMLLLQAELGSDGRAPAAATNALTVLKRELKGALKQGDQFVIFLNESDETVFLLNDMELHRVEDGGLFDFFFGGWVGPGASATFSQPLLSGTLDDATLARYEVLNPSSERIASIQGWVAPPPVVAAAPVPAPASAPAPEIVEDTAPPAVAQATLPVDAAAGESTPASAEAAPEPQDGRVATDDQQVLAALAPEPLPADAATPAATEEASAETPRPEPVEEVASAVAIAPELDIDDREYQRQLQMYISEVMKKVYGEVKYPRRAVKYSWEGRVELLARMDASGELIDVIVDSSSGYSGLDKAAESAIMRAAPFPELSPVARQELESDAGDAYIMSIPVTFALRR